jgi:hypothetical protein
MNKAIAAAPVASVCAFGVRASAVKKSPSLAEPGQAIWSGKVATQAQAEKAIEGWPQLAREAAQAMTAKYGRPDEIGSDALVWYSNGPWKRTLVHRLAWPHYTFMKDKDYVENVIGYGTPDDKVAPLTRFDKKLDADQKNAELSSRSESEAMNFLALNLADEIVHDKRTVEDARAYYVKISRLAAAGKSSPYLARLMFEVHNDASPNPWSRH